MYSTWIIIRLVCAVFTPLWWAAVQGVAELDTTEQLILSLAQNREQMESQGEERHLSDPF